MRDRRRDLADSVDVGFVGESSPRPGPSRRPDKEPLTPLNEVDSADESFPGPGGPRGFIRTGSIPPARTHAGRREISQGRGRLLWRLNWLRRRGCWDATRPSAPDSPGLSRDWNKK
ncbi:uncharacterized protein A4U43_C03F26000 [Asparagus officinalis]|uniref:Uncharacterized protein n=1 Tax=Asparagus officinalis TaxID=4686 RepID=A0A5P1FE10_ASPOF|nr:uncharacterized protein A4U43_C03F26000 [Asparagus officinalis]